MSNYIKLIVLGVITLVAMMGINFARDPAYLVHAVLIMCVAGGLPAITPSGKSTGGSF